MPDQQQDRVRVPRGMAEEAAEAIERMNLLADRYRLGYGHPEGSFEAWTVDSEWACNVARDLRATLETDTPKEE